MKLEKDLTDSERKIIQVIRQYMEDNKNGNIQINFNSGGITHLNLNESMRISK